MRGEFKRAAPGAACSADVIVILQALKDKDGDGGCRGPGEIRGLPIVANVTEPVDDIA
jgi:hypothetical protein